MRRILFALILIGILVGCSKTIHVPVETISTRIEYCDRFERDSIYIHDSVSFVQKGDTVWLEKWHTRYRDKLFRDTTYINKVDSVAIPYLVEKQLSRWNQFKIDYGGWAIIVVFVTVLIIFGMMVYKLKK